MEDKRNVTICFNSDDMYIVDFFQKKGKLSTEMKRVLKDYVDNSNQGNDMADVLDVRLAKILSIIVGNKMNPFDVNFSSVDMLSQLNSMQNMTTNTSDSSVSTSSRVEEDVEDVSEVDSFSLPPTSMIENFPFLNIDEED